MWQDWGVTKVVSRLFSRRKKQATVDEAPSSGASNKNSSTIKKIGLAFTSTYGARARRYEFEGPAGFSFEEIERAYLTDSYIRQACDKYVDYMFKAGFDIVGKNTKAVEYIKLRLAAMSVAIDKSLDEFLIEIAEDLVRFHNVFIVKARATNTYQYPKGITVKPVLSNRPVAGYFLLPVSTVRIARDINGTVRKYKQEISGMEPVEFNPEDIIHMAIDRPQGRAFGFPFLWQVLDDVKLLRQMEELVDRMIYKNLFPLLHYKVGLPEEGMYATDEEVDEVRATLSELPLDGGIVTSERHNIIPIGVGDKVIDAAPYLEYFKKRVFTGLGVSSTIMGEGDTVNKSTSDNLDQMFKDRVKAFQKVIENYFNSKIIYELLLEGGFDPITKPENAVYLRFREIDLQSKMAEQNHLVQLFTQNAITHEQLRLGLGYEPVTEEEENRLYFRMITIPTALETSKDSIAIKMQQAANNAGANKNHPTNQYGTRPSAKTESMVESVVPVTSIGSLYASFAKHYESMKSDVIMTVRRHINTGEPLSALNIKNVEMILRLGADYMATLANKHITSSFVQGVSDAKTQASKINGDDETILTQSSINFHYHINSLNEEVKSRINSVADDILEQINRTIKSSDNSDILFKISGIFDALQYRLKFISTNQVYKAYNTGFARAARDSGFNEAYIVSDLGCETCKSYQNKKVNLLSGDLPPFHPNCTCRLSLRKGYDE